MPDYANTKIYYIPVGNDRYYGHTTVALSSRKQKHKTSSQVDVNRKLYKAIREAKLDWENVRLVLVEAYPCKNVEEARAREAYWIESYGSLNVTVPFRTIEEKKAKKAKDDKLYNERHKEKIAEYHKQWRMENADKIKEKKSSREEKDKNNARKREKSTHCDICNCDIKGDKSAFDRHCKRPPHVLRAEGKWEEHIAKLKAEAKEREKIAKKAYNDAHKEEKAAYSKEYRKTYEPPEGRQEYLEAYNKKFYADNREREIQRAKDYQKDNKDKINERRKKHYQANKDKMNEKRREKYSEKSNTKV